MQQARKHGAVIGPEPTEDEDADLDEDEEEQQISEADQPDETHPAMKHQKRTRMKQVPQTTEMMM
ncbi:MAG: hypothetical protein JO166_02810 [Deltaproteobacteria bacterium]|nr:hypothetical protein [Deltaproteobacteria bacterium]